jgi:tetratricopeptide (TPR) repeat protein
MYKEKIARKEYRKLLKRFELGKLQEEDYVHLYKTYNLPFDSILLLASTFLHKGDYNKAISVYLALLEHVTDRVKKEELLELLGSTYFKGGFMQRSRDIFLKILRFSPRNDEALKHLLIIYERLKEYNKASEVLESLDELQLDIQTDTIYIKTLKILNDPILSFEKKTEQLDTIFSQSPIIERLFAQYLLQFNKEYFWKNLHRFEVKKFIDLLWYLNFDDIDFDAVATNETLIELYNAKGYINTCDHSDDFDLDILILLNKHEHKVNADLNFDFICTSCKHSHPIFDARCPHCQKILTSNIKYTLTKGLYEENQSLQ